jgi:MFS family permease
MTSSKTSDDHYAPSQSEAGATLSVALRSYAFWIFALATSLFGLASSGVGLFNQSILEQNGFEASDYYKMLGYSAMASLVGNFGGGALAQAWSYSRLLSVAMVLYGVALLWLSQLTGWYELLACTLLGGTSGGMITVAFFAVWRAFFGAKNLGQIQGAAQLCTVLASAVGPLLFAMSKDYLNSYTPAIIAVSSLAGLLAIAALLVPAPAAVESLEPEPQPV